MGMKKYIDKHIPSVKCVLTEPAEDNASHGIQGINDGADFLLNIDLMDEFICVKTEDAISRMKKFWKDTIYVLQIVQVKRGRQRCLWSSCTC